MSVDGRVSCGSARKKTQDGEVKALQALKGNRPLFYEEVKRFFDEECMKGIRKKENGYKKTIEPEHGGSVAREYYIIEDTGGVRALGSGK